MVRIRRLIWDAGNVAHIARHDVQPHEVEEVCHGGHVVRQAYNGRLMLIGPTNVGRLLTVVLAPQGGGAHYPVTSYPASVKARRIYRRERGERR